MTLSPDTATLDALVQRHWPNAGSFLAVIIGALAFGQAPEISDRTLGNEDARTLADAFDRAMRDRGEALRAIRTGVTAAADPAVTGPVPAGPAPAGPEAAS